MGNEVGKLIRDVQYGLTLAGGGFFEVATIANAILEIARETFRRGSDDVVKDLVLSVSKRTLRAMGEDLGNAFAIWEEIFTNKVNKEALEVILRNRSELARFLVNLAEPAKQYATATSIDGLPSAGNGHTGTGDPYNELNLASPMNRHAVICQLQRLAKSLSYILAKGKQGVLTLEGLEMNTSLRSDGDPTSTETYAATAPEGQGSNNDEEWLFVNGICGEYFWLKLYCDKLKTTFGRKITGIFNRSDGILWDLVESAGERFPASGDTLIQRTKSSMDAQKNLRDELSKALNEEKNKYVVMIAYSQGCLLLRLVLEDFITTGEYREAMKYRLRVFTFGNPSIDWRVKAGADSHLLSTYVNHTEHFANKIDFVAKLGVVTGHEAAEGSYIDHKSSLTFINMNEDWTGHLFGTQYSLQDSHYMNGVNSKLLACNGGQAMSS